MLKNRFSSITTGCVLVAGLSWPAAQAVQAGANERPSAASQDLQHRWKVEAEAFAKAHPELKSFDPANLEARREADRLWHEKVQTLAREWTESQSTSSAPADPTAKQGTSSAWPKDSKADPDARTSLAPGSESAAQAGAMLPNEMVSPFGPPSSVNPSVAFQGIIPGQAYGVRTDFVGPPLGTPSMVGASWTPAAGSGAPWLFLPVIPILMFPFQWNPTITYNPPPFPMAYFETHTEYVLPALMPPSPSAIVVTPSLGTGAPFPTGGPPSVVAIAPGPTFWLDYPYIVSDNHPLNPVGPGGQGDIHVAWVQYVGGAPDVNANANLYDDPGDGYIIFAASSNSGGGPFPYPVFTPPVALFGGPIMPGAHQVVRPSLSVAGPAGTPAGPPPTVYCAWINPVPASILVAYNPVGGLGAPWTAPVFAAPVTPLPPALAPGLRASSSVSIAVDDGPLFPGMVYIAWSDYATGDADILFSLSGDGGLTWLAPTRVNQDPIGNGRDQWAPHMVVNAATGEIVVTYFDRRNDPGNVMIQTWASTSLTGGATWTDALVSDIPPVAPPGGLPYPPGFYMGDYLGSSADYGFGANPWGAIWNDGRTGPISEVFFEVVRTIDSDGDGVTDALDNCPFTFNPGQADADADGYGDVCDNCPQVSNPNQLITVALTGDINLSGTYTSADVILLVNYVFKGGAAPVPCPANGDVNCNGSVTSADIIILVNHVFKGGPAPCNVCTAPGLGWSCP